jgi:hypothetical protein
MAGQPVHAQWDFLKGASRQVLRESVTVVVTAKLRVPVAVPGKNQYLIATRVSFSIPYLLLLKS